MKIQSQNIYFKNTPPPPPPWRLSGGPLMTNHRMSSLAIIRSHKDTSLRRRLHSQMLDPPCLFLKKFRLSMDNRT